ncbi:hypothetical protein VET10_17760 [Escherichia coli]|nr:hypothetical protein VET10_17760 [Escherichia coli]
MRLFFIRTESTKSNIIAMIAALEKVKTTPTNKAQKTRKYLTRNKPTILISLKK